jgi:ketosteroid isomerase-like protein
MSEQNVEIVRDTIAAFNRGGVEAALEYFDPDLEWIGPPEWLEDRIYRGHDGIRKIASVWTENFDEYRLDIDRVIDAGDHVVVLLYQRGRIKGSADQIEQPIGYDWEVREGKGTRVGVYFSWDEALKAVGLAE